MFLASKNCTGKLDTDVQMVFHSLLFFFFDSLLFFFTWTPPPGGYLTFILYFYMEGQTLVKTLPSLVLRTRAVITQPDSSLDKNLVRRPGVEPGSIAWKATMLTVTPPTLLYAPHMYTKTVRQAVWSEFTDECQGCYKRPGGQPSMRRCVWQIKHNVVMCIFHKTGK